MRSKKTTSRGERERDEYGEKGAQVRPLAEGDDTVRKADRRVAAMRSGGMLLAGVLLAAAFCAWCPWISDGVARSRAVQAFEAGQRGVQDGCGFNCKGCGAAGARKAPFGYWVALEYACGLLPEDAPQYHRSSERFVSFLGTVHERAGTTNR